MQIITLSPALLDEACSRLSEETQKALEHIPDAIIGIRSGGAPIAESIAEHIGVKNVAYADASRPGSGIRALLAPLLKAIPRCVTDRLRTVESRILHHNSHDNRGGRRNIAFSISGEITMHIAATAVPLLLVVDDAVDSGATLHGVVTGLANMFPHARIVTASITVTTPDPVIMPDICLYRDTLVRFPWSADYRDT